MLSFAVFLAEADKFLAEDFVAAFYKIHHNPSMTTIKNIAKMVDQARLADEGEALLRFVIVDDHDLYAGNGFEFTHPELLRQIAYHHFICYGYVLKHGDGLRYELYNLSPTDPDYYRNRYPSPRKFNDPEDPWPRRFESAGIPRNPGPVPVL